MATSNVKGDLVADPSDPSQWPMTEEGIRQCVNNYVKSKMFLSPSVIEDMKFESVISTTAYHYQLNTFTEKRVFRHVSIPYNGGDIDGDLNGPPLYDIPFPCRPSVDDRVRVKVPH